MKPLYFLFLIPLLLVGCEKNTPNETDVDDVPGLPPVTQTGANTLGFLLNGVPWTPQGNNGTANLSMDFDPNLFNGVFSIAAYKASTENDISYFGIGLRDSLNSIVAPKTFPIGKHTLAGVFFSDTSCFIDYFSTDIYRNGYIRLTKYDRIKRVISGTFEVSLFTPQCSDTIHITKGRFDMDF